MIGTVCGGEMKGGVEIFNGGDGKCENMFVCSCV